MSASTGYSCFTFGLAHGSPCRTGMKGGIDGGQCEVISHLFCHMIHIEIIRIDGLHILDHLIGNTEERGIDHIVFPQGHLMDMAFIQ